MTVAASLAAWGILRPAEVVELAAAAGLDLACAVTMLEKESGGGRNVWGSDGVDTGGAYVKGGPVTRDNYLAYRALAQAHKIGRQGVGPAQLTYYTLQDQADLVGGCWDWRANVTVGFRHLAQLQRSYGIRGGFRRYNGDGPAAERYADDALARLAKWRTRIGPTPAPPTPTAAPVEDDDMTPEQAQKLDILFSQLVTGPDPAAWGWPTFPGGSNDRFTVVDYLRKQNQRAEDNARDLALLRESVAALARQVAALPTTGAAAGAVVGVPAAFEFTGIATPTTPKVP